jgi:pimeloyl-ACP methyl ester carboxylesterase
VTTNPLLSEQTALEHLRRAASVAGLEVDVGVPADRQQIAGSIRLHYLDWGDAPGPAILFLHGTALTAHTWDIACLALRARFRCLAIDLRGHGDSEWSPQMDYSLDAQVGDIERFVENLDLEQFVLVGMSLGGLVAIGYAIRHSERLKGLVIVDASLKLRSRSRVRDFLALNPELPSIEDFVERALEFNSRRKPELLRISLLHNLRRLPNGGYAWKYDHRHWSNLDLDKMRAEREALASGLPAIACPALVIRGAESEVLLDEEAAKLAHELPKGRWASVSSAGHTIQGDNPLGLVNAMMTFFAEIGIG